MADRKKARKASPPVAPARDALFRPVFLALLAASVLPLWITRYLPMVDLPQHLGLINALHHLRDPGARFGEFLAVRPSFTPYLGYYWTVHLLSYALPVEVANRLVLTGYAVALPAAALALARAFSRSDWLSLFAFPLTYAYDFYMGFVNYLAALALMLLAIALYALRLSGRVRGRAWDVALVALPVACIATHAQPYSFFAAALVVLLVAFPGQRLAALYRAAPSLAVFAWWLGSGGTGPANIPLRARAFFQPFAWRVENFSRFALNNFKDRLDLLLLILLAAVWAWALAQSLGRRADAARPRAQRPSTGLRTGLVAPLLAAGAVGGYFLMPTEIPPTLYTISPRYATLSCLLLALAVPLAVPSRAWRGALIGACAAHALYIGVQLQRFDAEVGDFRALAEKMEPNSCVATVAGYFPSRLMNEEQMFNHFTGYLALWRGALPSYTFAGLPHSPLAYKRKDGSLADGFQDAAFPAITVAVERRLERQGALLAAYGSFYRYFLVSKVRPLEELLGPDAGRLSLIGESGPLRLYLNPAGTCGNPA